MIPRSGYFLTILFICIALLAPLAAHAGALGTWSWRNPRPTGNDLNGIAWGNGQYVAVGANGIILTSPDGVDWCPRTPNVATPQLDLNDVAWGNGRFVAVGDDCAILVSSDGLIWTRRELGYQGTLYGVSWCLDRFLAVGAALCGGGGVAALFSSPVGAVWEAVRLEGQADVHDVGYGNGRYVAVGDGMYMLTSSDGLAWESAPAHPLWGVTFAQGIFVAVGGVGGVISISEDGIGWTDVSSYDSRLMLDRVVYGNGIFVAVGSSVYHSTDGRVWEEAGEPRGMNDLASSGEGFVGVGSRGSIATSSDGDQWTTPRGRNLPDLGGVVWGGGRFVAVNQTWVPTPVAAATGSSRTGAEYPPSGTSYTSPNGTTWKRTRGLPPFTGSITYGYGLFEATDVLGRLFVSADGEQWEEQPVGPYMLTSVRCVGGRFVALGRTDVSTCVILMSLDGRQWLRVLSVETAYIYDVEYGNGIWVAPAQFKYLTSVDGWNWTVRDAPGRGGGYSYVFRIAFGNGKFVMTGDHAYLSSDGRTWEEITEFHDPVAITFEQGRFLGIDADGDVPLQILTSRYGRAWKQRDVKVRGVYLLDIACGDRSCVAVGNEGSILQSGSFGSTGMKDP